jgi:hypothetical protein
MRLCVMFNAMMLGAVANTFGHMTNVVVASVALTVTETPFFGRAPVDLE